MLNGTKLLGLRLSALLMVGCIACSSGTESATDTPTTTTGVGTQPPATQTTTQTVAPTTPTPTAAPATAIPTPVASAYALTVLFTDFGRYTQKNLALRVIDVQSGKVLDEDGLQITGPQFSITLDDILEKDLNYQVDIWVDWNGNGQYEPPATNPQDAQNSDQSWRLDVINVQSDKQQSLSSGSPQTDVDW